MKKNIYWMGIFVFSIISSCISNDDDSGNLSTIEFEEDVRALQTSLDLIEALAGQSVCADGFTCESIALGEKACGGPKSYLIYSSSIDTDNLETMVATHNTLEKAFNIKWDIVSDCLFVGPPSFITCENGKCVASTVN